MSNKTSSSDRIREKKKLFLDREQKIIDAALELFLKESIDCVTVSKIASKAGIGCSGLRGRNPYMYYVEIALCDLPHC